MDELKTFLTEEEYNSVIELARFMIMPDPTQFVELARIDGVKFIVHSNEQCGHHKAHVHIQCGEAEYELSIPEGDILNASGKISKFKLKKARNCSVRPQINVKFQKGKREVVSNNKP